ncbi:MAG: O-antigen ligase family protein [Parcubacteria group bacterium]
MEKNNKITEFLIYATIFLLPAYLVKVSVFGVPTNALEILMLAVIASGFIFLEPSSWKLQELGSRRKIVLCLSLIFLGLLISILVNKNYAVGFGIIKSWFILPLLFSWIATAGIPEEKRKNIYYAYYFSALTVAIISLGYYIYGAVTFDGRLQGIFNSPNYLAMYLVPGLIISIWYLVFSIKKRDQKKKKTFAVIGLAVILVALYLTYSYAAWIALILSLVITIIIKNKKINKKITTGGLIIIFILFISQQNTEKLNNIQSSPHSSLASRVMIWNSAAKILGDNIAFGIGPGNFQQKYLEYQKYFPPYLEWAVPHPHNLYLAWWLYGGMLSFVGFIALIFFWLKEMLGKEKNSLWAISFAIMLYFLIHGLVDTTYFKNDLAVIFWLNFFIGLFYTTSRPRD